MKSELLFTGERFIPHQTDPILALEHYHRYYFASRFAQGKRILDVACGEGYGSAFLSRYADTVVGIDSDGPTVEHARRKYASLRNLHFETSRCEENALADHSFDMVVAFELLEHLDSPDQARFLENARRLLKPDGLFLVSSPDRDEYAAVHPSPNEFHKHEMTLQELQGVLGSHFKHIHLCAQRVLSLSALWQLEGRQEASFSFFSRQDLLEGIPAGRSFAPPLYIVALCSNEPLPDQTAAESNSFYLDLSNSDQTKLSQWADQLTAETLKGRQTIADLQQQLEERTAWVMSLKEQVQHRDEFIEIKKLEIETLQQEIESMKKELESRAQWAYSLESDVAHERNHASQEHENFLKECEHSAYEHARAEAAHQELQRTKIQVSSSFLYRALAKLKLLPNVWSR